MAARTIQIRRDTAANWAAVNPVLSLGELGYETDTKTLKVGDGVTAWVSLQSGASGVKVVNSLPASSERGKHYFVIAGANTGKLYFTPSANDFREQALAGYTTIGAQFGGTGNTSYQKGDILAAKDSTTLVKVAKGTDGQALIADSSAESGIKWGNVASQQTATPQTGGTGITSYQKGDILVAVSSNQLVKLSKGNEGDVLTVDGTTATGLAWKIPAAAAAGNTTPPTPTNGVVDDTANTFDFTYSAGYTNPTDYEYTTDGGSSFNQAASKPISNLTGAYPAGQVGVRVKAASGRNPSGTLYSTAAFTAPAGGQPNGLVSWNNTANVYAPDGSVTYNGEGVTGKAHSTQLLAANTTSKITFKASGGFTIYVMKTYPASAIPPSPSEYIARLSLETTLVTIYTSNGTSDSYRNDFTKTATSVVGTGFDGSGNLTITKDGTTVDTIPSGATGNYCLLVLMDSDGAASLTETTFTT